MRPVACLGPAWQGLLWGGAGVECPLRAGWAGLVFLLQNQCLGGDVVLGSGGQGVPAWTQGRLRPERRVARPAPGPRSAPCLSALEGWPDGGFGRGEWGPRRGDVAFESFGDPDGCARRSRTRGASWALPPAPRTRVQRKAPLESLLVTTARRQHWWHGGPPLPSISTTEPTPARNKTKKDPPIPPHPPAGRVSSS